MGAMLRFKRETGREVTELDGGSLSDLCTYLWCCVKSASSADGRDFGLSLMEFADVIDPGVLREWLRQAEGADGGGTVEKKSV